MRSAAILSLLCLLSTSAFAFIPSLSTKTSFQKRHHHLLQPPYLSQQQPIHKTTTSLYSTAATPTSIPHLTEAHLETLSKQNYIIIPNYIDSTLITSLQNDIATLRSADKFNVAKIGQDATNTLNTNIRVAETCFLGRDKLSDVPSSERTALYNVLDNLRNDLSSNAEKLGSSPLDNSLSELLYAYYPTGGFYKRHVDAVQGSASVLRCFSLLLYLNEEWTEEDGGQLRIHLDGGGDEAPPNSPPNFIDVQPQGGTLVLFKSDAIPHEVLNTNKQRMVVIGWFNRAVTAADVTNLTSEEDRTKAVMLLVAAGLVSVGLGMIVMG